MKFIVPVEQEKLSLTCISDLMSTEVFNLNLIDFGIIVQQTMVKFADKETGNNIRLN